MSNTAVWVWAAIMLFGALSIGVFGYQIGAILTQQGCA